MKKFIILVSVMAGALLATSCLQEDTSAIVSPYKFFETPAQIRAALNGCYDPLNSIHDLRYYIAIEGACDIASTPSSAQPDARFDINPARPGAGNNVWPQCYYGVRKCLSTLAGIHRSSLDESDKAPYEAECRILLSYYYYVLTSFFGDVPFYEDYVENEDDMARIAKLGRMPATETRQTLIEELKLYVPYLEQIRTFDIRVNGVNYNYCGAAMGWMMIAKLAAWNKDWDDVIMACEHLESIYGDLTQYPYSDVCFRNKHTAESIFEINHEWEEGGIDYTTYNNTALSAIVIPYRTEEDKKVENMYDGVIVPELGNKAYSYRPVKPSSYMKTYVAPSGTGDIRREFNFASSWSHTRINPETGKEETVTENFNSVWMGHKFWCFGVYHNDDSNNYKIFRYADALLLLAEAWCEKGNFPKSIEYLNKVRARAELTPYSFVGEVKLRGEIRDERARELFGEWGRKYDLVRWGIWYDQVVAYNTYNLVQENVRPCHEYYPIPDVQCARSGRILSNPEYDKYNLSGSDE
ncbi:MAG: RagB/SusD family nutrient uptake outer membrane protein [Bacteroidales bacterium]|nr:RagB/SusD family nutrient uptake outer membrane protein [Bacteroidales bacterium]